jgi:hypothetical protein
VETADGCSVAAENRREPSGVASAAAASPPGRSTIDAESYLVAVLGEGLGMACGVHTLRADCETLP